MVHGIEKFKEYFYNYAGNYVFIGGTACSILLDDVGDTFRATKDLDIVLIIEAIDESFGIKFWEFIKDGGYKNRQMSTEKEQFYRFSHPKNRDFPAMIELFCRRSENIRLHFDSGLTPIYIGDEVASLSAILLNDDYYNLLLKGKKMVDGYSVLDLEYIILYKIRAWLDLLKKTEEGKQIDSKTIKKHKNDIFRLLINVSPSSLVDVEDIIYEDISMFLEKIINDKPNLRDLGIRNVTFEELLERIKILYINRVKEQTT